ncbi:unnamed protein product, partial [Mesorhabditis belari]|uniref:Uncharacterized protein n=1 Tax=Mesorhabditis belari TaxID=2138241 RepID=A0AAF3F846_9BILA
MAMRTRRSDCNLVSMPIKDSLEKGAGVKCAWMGGPHRHRFHLPTSENDEEIAAVVVSFDGHISYPKIMQKAHPIGRRSRGHFVFGKPNTPIADFLKRHHHIDATKTIMFGDRLDTDIMFANGNGFTSCLMLIWDSFTGNSE